VSVFFAPVKKGQMPGFDWIQPKKKMEGRHTKVAGLFQKSKELPQVHV
jgi:hypothetical protein